MPKAKNKVSGAGQMVKNMIVMTILLTVIGVGMSAAGYKYVAAYTVIMLIPGLMGILVDWRKGRHASRSIFVFNLAGLMPQLIAIFISGSPNHVAVTQLYEFPKTAVVPWVSAIFGWSVVFLFPKIVEIFLEIRASYIIGHLEEEQEKMLDEWGEDIKKYVPKSLADKRK